MTEIRPHALVAAGIAEAAAAQQRFWAVHELLFHRRKALTEVDLLAYAREVGLDEARLNDDLGGDVIWQRVKEDAASAIAAGAQGTPTLFIDGRLHPDGFDRESLRSTLYRIEAT